ADRRRVRADRVVAHRRGRGRAGSIEPRGVVALLLRDPSRLRLAAGTLDGGAPVQHPRPGGVPAPLGGLRGRHRGDLWPGGGGVPAGPALSRRPPVTAGRSAPAGGALAPEHGGTGRVNSIGFVPRT